jgi:hypothetical protein
LPVFNKEESLLFLADKELLQPLQDVHQLEIVECAILLEDQLDLDPHTLLAYNKEV